MELGLEIEEQSLDGARFRDSVIKIRWSQVHGQCYKEQMELGLGIEFKNWMELSSEIEEQRLDGARFRDRVMKIRWNQVQGQSLKIRWSQVQGYSLKIG